MSYLIIQLRFIAHSYTGIRFLDDRTEELDWPPSPGRVHEALLCAALLGVTRSASEREKVFAAFRWLDELAAPEIWASAHDATLRTSPRIAIPQNNPKKSKQETKPSLLAPTRRAVSVTGEPLEVHYHWPLNAKAMTSKHLNILSDAAARVSYLGRAEDRAEVALILADTLESLPLVRWQPDPNGDALLWVTKPGTTDGLEERHTAIVAPRETRKPAQRWMRRVAYADDAPRARQPIAIAIFQLFPADDDPDANALACDAESAGLWRKFLRRQIVKLADDAENWDDHTLAQELLTGHSAPGQRATRPHLAIVPLPTINRARTADGRVRRVALLGYAAPEVAAQAVPIYETLFKALDDLIESEDTPLRRHGKVVPVRLVRNAASADKVWPQYTGKSRVWCSIIPVAIARGFKVPKFHPDGRELTANECHRRKLNEWEKLLRDSLRHIGLPPELIAACTIDSTMSPLVPRSSRSENYRPPGESAVLTHVRLEFPSEIRGPLLVGDRRYLGLGLFAPALN
jgi:CRISPR-associated protein Csb2